MASEEFWALWQTRNGQKLWEGPFTTVGRAWGFTQQLIGPQQLKVLSGTQMSNTVPSIPAAEFQAATVTGGYGPWFTAGYSSPCDGTCGEDIEVGDRARADGQGGWLCSSCGELVRD